VPVFGEKKSSSAAAPASPPTGADKEKTAQETHTGFLDFVKNIVDIVNPLQHIPIIGAIYRHITGDEINPVTRIAGDALFGGPIGAGIGVADVAYQKITGEDPGETMIALVTGPRKEETTQIASQASWSKDIVWDTPAQPPSPQETPSPAPTGAPVPVAAARVPAKMAEALDKYAAMKSAGLAPRPQTFSASF
jgi:hypothetical protein